MSTILITSDGTLGDSLPYIALGKSLKNRGHKIRMVVNEAVYSYVLKAGLEIINDRAIIGSEEVQRNAQLWNQLPSLKKQSLDKTKIVKYKHSIIHAWNRLYEACDDADMLISDFDQDIIAGLIADTRSICWVRSSVAPFYQCSYNPKIKHQLYYHSSWLDNKKSNYFLLAASPHFCQLSPEYSHVHQIGFWFYENSDWSDRQPSKEIRKFVEYQSKPLVLSYSSIPVENPDEFVKIHVRAAAKLGRRILIHQGWADCNESHLPSDIERDNVMFANGLIADDWLCSHAAALITHGEVETVARSLRNGCPVLVEPLGNDHFFNALQVQKLGVGTAMDSQRLTADRVANILQKKILTPDYKRRAVEVGEKIKAEQGLIQACDLIESWLPK